MTNHVRLAMECCHVDYDQSLPLIALVSGEIVGIARLAVDKEAQDGDISFLIADEWQNTGIASILMDSMIKICPLENIKTIHGSTDVNNIIMKAIFSKFNFEQKVLQDDTVKASYTIK